MMIDLYVSFSFEVGMGRVERHELLLPTANGVTNRCGRIPDIFLGYG